VTTQQTILAAVAVGLMLFGFLGFAIGEYMVAGLAFLLGSMTIYVREKRF